MALGAFLPLFALQGCIAAAIPLAASGTILKRGVEGDKRRQAATEEAVAATSASPTAMPDAVSEDVAAIVPAAEVPPAPGAAPYYPFALYAIEHLNAEQSVAPDPGALEPSGDLSGATLRRARPTGAMPMGATAASLPLPETSAAISIF